MRKIQEKMEKLNKIKEACEGEETQDESEIAVTESFGEKIRKLMEDINVNIDATYNKLDKLEEKIKENDEQAKE